ncbi:MAG: hypothetical protein KAW41_02795 [Candidatus Diapherotrites archaeon]|nr:hypothetical protein [Candidatus Diapherotrites archaeon]
MRLKDFFNFADLVRVLLIGSSLLLIVGMAYGVFLHAMYASQVEGVQNDLTFISKMMKTKAGTAYSDGKTVEALEYKAASARAEELSKMIKSPPVTPSAYTYFNYWIASAAFTKLTLNPKIIGLPDDTVVAFAALESESILGEAGWWGREEFRGYDVNKGTYRIFLEKEPILQTHFWSLYIFVFLIAFMTTLITVKEEYEVPVVPEIVYGAFMPTLFFAVYSVTSLVSLTGIIKFLDPSQIDVFVLMLSFVIMGVISAVGAMLAAIVRPRKKRE